MLSTWPCGPCLFACESLGKMLFILTILISGPQKLSRQLCAMALSDGQNYDHGRYVCPYHLLVLQLSGFMSLY